MITVSDIESISAMVTSQSQTLHSAAAIRLDSVIYEITPQGVDPSDPGRHKWTRPAYPQPCRLVLHLPTPEGWKAELT